MDFIRLVKKIRALIPQGQSAYVAGGAVRDWILRGVPVDLDIVVPEGALSVAQRAVELLSGTLVPLDAELGVARVVRGNVVLDFSQFREGATCIDQDLHLRDFTLNAMAVRMDEVDEFLASLENGRMPAALIDPEGGLKDLRAGVIRAIGWKNLVSDPLRILRAYRFMAQFGFEINPQTREWITGLVETIDRIASERVEHELAVIMSSSRAASTFSSMAEDGLLRVLLPELEAMRGVEQPGFHHLDVYGHSLEALASMERLISDPCFMFDLCDPMAQWLDANQDLMPYLKWAALLHDVGKPCTKGEKEGRVTFYHHDLTGADILLEIGRRLRWPRRKAEFAARLVRLHMRPFFLLTDLRRGGPTPRALRRLAREIEGHCPALFLLSMADSMAGCGPLKPADLDQQLSHLWEKFYDFYMNLLKPKAVRPRLLNGNDIQRIFGLPPGPVIGACLDALEEARVEGAVSTRQDALTWVQEWLKKSQGP